MATELFLAPMIGDGTKLNPFRGKYTNDPSVTLSGAIRLGRQDEAVILIEAPQAYLDSVAAQSDAIRLATQANLDSILTAQQANAVKNFLEARGIPGQLANTGDSRRQVIRGVVGVALFCQRMEGRFGTSFKRRAALLGITLNTKWSDFPQALQDEFIAIRDEHGWGNLGLTNQSTLRDILLAISAQFELTPIFIANTQI